MRIVCMKSNITDTNWERENAIYEILPTNLALKILLVPLFAMLTQAFFPSRLFYGHLPYYCYNEYLSLFRSLKIAL